MTPSEVFDSALSTVSASVSLCRQSLITRRRSRALRGQLADLSLPSTSRGCHFVRGTTKLPPSSAPQVGGTVGPGEAACPQFGTGLGYAFKLEGLLNGSRVTAALDSEGKLTCDLVLWAQAEVLAALGELLTYGDDSRTLPAGLGSPLQALVTFMHCLEVTNFSISLEFAPGSQTDGGAPRNLGVYRPLGHSHPRLAPALRPGRKSNRRLRAPRSVAPPPYGHRPTL
jgi:hypothetical protein